MNKKGSVLIIVFLAIMVLSLVGGAMFWRTISERSSAKAYKESTQAFWLAEAGAQRALWEINGNGSWDNWTDCDDADHCKELAKGVYDNYEVRIEHYGGNNPEITSTGYGPSDSYYREIKVTLEGSGLFSYAAFGDNSVTLGGNGATDSYNSGDGDYGGENIASNGDVGTNGDEEGAVTINGENAQVNGDASTGQDGTIDGEESVSGAKTHDNNVELSAVSIPSDLSGLSDSGEKKLSNEDDSQTLSAGDYHFSSIQISGGTLTLDGVVRIYLTDSHSLTISGGGSLAVNGQLELYTTGDCNVGGNGIVNDSELPSNLIVYSTYETAGESDGFTLSGNAHFYGAVYAPNANLKVSGDGDIYGSLVGKTAAVTGNGDIHYDEALQDLGGGGYTVASWKETRNPYSLE